MLVNGYPHDYHGNQYTWWVGRVEATTGGELNDPEAVNRVRVRIFGFQDMDFPVEDLPLCTVIMPPTVGYGYGGGGQVHGLHKMDIVTGFFMDHDMQMPVVTGVIMGKPIEPDQLLEGGGSSGGGGGGGGGGGIVNPAAVAAISELLPQPQFRASDSIHTVRTNLAPIEQEQEFTQMTSENGAEFSNHGIQGATADKSIPATLRHNNPLGNNTSGLANAFNQQLTQNLDGTNTIASFADTSDGYGYSFSQMYLNATRAGTYDANGRLYYTPKMAGDLHYTPGYNGTDIMNAVGNNNRVYFDTWSQGWNDITSAMEVREADPGLQNRTKNNLGLSSSYDFGQNTSQKQVGFQKMQKHRGVGQ